jgi:hypothetical protein
VFARRACLNSFESLHLSDPNGSSYILSSPRFTKCFSFCACLRSNSECTRLVMQQRDWGHLFAHALIFSHGVCELACTDCRA